MAERSYTRVQQEDEVIGYAGYLRNLPYEVNRCDTKQQKKKSVGGHTKTIFPEQIESTNYEKLISKNSLKTVLRNESIFMLGILHIRNTRQLIN